uniref:Condensin complex subunit 1 n=1 Tax=Caenorhabditis japonica TaxID=281687 RepID=A0A8R1IP32_CAEJA
MQLHQANDDRVVEDEQAAADKLHTVLQLRAQIQQLIDKMIVEVELSNCIDIALRCVLMGETAEIKEGIKFLTRCKLFEITGAETAIRSMCSLVWRPSADVITELIDAAEDMFISKLDGNEKASERDKSTVENLMKAMHGATEMDRPSIEEVIYLLASVGNDDEGGLGRHRKRRHIETNVITRLWAIALDNSTGGTNKKIDALRILYPISRTEKGIPEARTRIRSLQKKLMDEPAVAVEALRIISILNTPTKQEKGSIRFIARCSAFIRTTRCLDPS